MGQVIVQLGQVYGTQKQFSFARQRIHSLFAAGHCNALVAETERDVAYTQSSSRHHIHLERNLRRSPYGENRINCVYIAVYIQLQRVAACSDQLEGKSIAHCLRQIVPRDNNFNVGHLVNQIRPAADNQFHWVKAEIIVISSQIALGHRALELTFYPYLPAQCLGHFHTHCAAAQPARSAVNNLHIRIFDPVRQNHPVVHHMGILCADVGHIRHQPGLLPLQHGQYRRGRLDGDGGLHIPVDNHQPPLLQNFFPRKLHK